ncbi:MAG: serine hydroxymethyltransferase [Pseudomonadaceae bacterium]|nr:serine hydroxymethyltransferase [Pseudomonadaceae bacterium]
MASTFFTQGVAKDESVAQAIAAELQRERDSIELIASENIVSKAVLEAQGSVLTNKYAEGYPGKRYYGGCAPADAVEELARQRACQLFGCKFANVQPHSGSQANQAVFFALLNPGDKILGLRLDQGGHLTHGHTANMSGKWFEPHFYGVRQDSETIDYDELERVANEVKPALVTAGASAYPREIDFERMAAIAHGVGAKFMADIAHIAGLVAAGEHVSPFPHADVVTTTTHKTLRGPRGGMILTNDEALAKKLNSAVFPGFQGGPLMHVIAGKAVAFGEALQPQYKQYIKQVKTNCVALVKALQDGGVRVVSGGTDNHLCLVDLRPLKLTGKAVEHALDEVGLTCNKNMVPYDTESPVNTSGIRLGTPAGTTRGFGEVEFAEIGALIAEMVQAMAAGTLDVTAPKVKARVAALCAAFPIYEGMTTGVAQAA